MQIHELQPNHKMKNKKRIGRGGKRGTYSGRGIKGQKARAGRKLEPITKNIIKKIPKLRGSSNRLIQKKSNEFTKIINLSLLEKTFEPKDIVSPKTLLKKEIIEKIKGKIPKVKILADGEITKPLYIQGCEVSKMAREKILKVGGKID
ncbi:MAG: uL15 family ribosomal protein [Minisyncoccia bacterium]